MDLFVAVKPKVNLLTCIIHSNFCNFFIIKRQNSKFCQLQSLRLLEDLYNNQEPMNSAMASDQIGIYSIVNMYYNKKERNEFATMG